MANGPIVHQDANKDLGTPLVDLTGRLGRYVIEGESLSADCDTFYRRVLAGLKGQTEGLSGANITFEFNLTFVNTISLGGIRDIATCLDDLGKKNKVEIVWRMREDRLQKAGRFLADKLKNVRFSFVDET